MSTSDLITADHDGIPTGEAGKAFRAERKRLADEAAANAKALQEVADADAEAQAKADADTQKAAAKRS